IIIFLSQEVVKNVNEVEFIPGRYDVVLLASQACNYVQKLAEEIRELTFSRSVSIFNGNYDSNVSDGNECVSLVCTWVASYFVPAAAIGAMGYCYKWWKARDCHFLMLCMSQSKIWPMQFQKLEILNRKVKEQKEMSKLIMNE
ncbi:hypothetical protein MKX03_028191, partial [Papaver bracteatum]